MPTNNNPKRCSRCRKIKSRDEFRTRTDPPNFGKPHPWCSDCKREYDRLTVAAKRQFNREAIELISEGWVI